MIPDSLLNYWSGVAAAAAMTFATAPLSVQDRPVWQLLATAAAWFLVSGTATVAALVIASAKSDAAMVIVPTMDARERAGIRSHAYGRVRGKTNWLLILNLMLTVVAVVLSAGAGANG